MAELWRARVYGGAAPEWGMRCGGPRAVFIGWRSALGVRTRAGNHGEIPGRELRYAGETELPSGAHGSAAGSACGPGVRGGLTSRPGSRR